jgi:hypothetical protein
MLSLWSRLPVSVRAVITGLAVAAADTTPWAMLVRTNQKHHPAYRGRYCQPLFTCGYSRDMFGEIGGLARLLRHEE